MKDRNYYNKYNPFGDYNPYTKSKRKEKTRYKGECGNGVPMFLKYEKDGSYEFRVEPSCDKLSCCKDCNWNKICFLVCSHTNILCCYRE